MINTLLLLMAAVVYGTFGYLMKLSEGLTRGLPSSLVMVLFCLGAALQMLAMRQREMSTTYIIVLGLEAITVLVLGILFLNEGITPLKFTGVILIVLGVLALRS